MGDYYKKKDIKERKYYGAPDFIKADFSGIKAREIIIQEGDRLDYIAHNLYGNANYWKALALFNDIGYLFNLEVGKILRLPYRIEEVLERI